MRRHAVAALSLLLAAAALVQLGNFSGKRLERSAPELGRAQWARLEARLAGAPERYRPAAALDQNAPQEIRIPDRTRPLRPAPDDARLGSQAEIYDAARPKSIVELQKFRSTTVLPIQGAHGRAGTATLINLNPTVNAWYLLELDWQDGGNRHETYHLANSHPSNQDLELDPAFPHGLVLADNLLRIPCPLWSDEAPVPLRAALESRSPYVSLCDEGVSLRLRTAGHKTQLEKVTDFLRDNLWLGEAITVFVRETFFQDAHLQTGVLTLAGDAAPSPLEAPLPALLEPSYEGQLVEPVDLGLVLDTGTPGKVAVGRWYKSRGNRGIFVSAVQPKLVAREILAGHRDRVGALDAVESEALAYLVAFDLERFELGFALGTDHPRTDWSERSAPRGALRSLPGPDGIGSAAPLISTGIIGPAVAPRTAATFTGGFKRSHGAFKTGALAKENLGSHYGFIENGVVFSKLQPGLATLLVLADQTVDLRTWSRDDDALLERIRFARQNGVPLIERGPDGSPVPGALVNRWREGNWSGSQDEKFRTLRAAVCLLERDQNRYLAYGYFSSATPSAMVRVFQAYGCRYAMHLDMNALEHTYLALYRVESSRLIIQHLVEGMSVLDRSDGRELPRFLGYADNRDFFYLLRRQPS